MTERAKPYEGHLKARFYEIRLNMHPYASKHFIEALSDKAPGPCVPVRITERLICSPDLRTHICSGTPSIPHEWMDYSVEWAKGYEPTEEDREYWDNQCSMYPPDERFNYSDWYNLVDGSRESLGHPYKFKDNVVASHDMGVIELDENQKSEVNEEDETEVERLLWDIAREQACANHHV